MNKVFSIMFLSAIIAVFTVSPLLGDTQPSTNEEVKKDEPKPWITDSSAENVEQINNELLKHPERHEKYEQATFAKIKMFPEDYVGRRFVFDKCYVEPTFEEASSLYFGNDSKLYVTFVIKPRSCSEKLRGSGDFIFVAKKTFARQWADAIGDGNFAWTWSVVSGTILKYAREFQGKEIGKPTYAFVVDEFVICNTKTGKPISTLFFCEEPVSDKQSPETKSFVVINSRFDLNPKEEKTPSQTSQFSPQDRKAQELYNQGMRYYDGKGAIQDYRRAFQLLKEAADLGDLKACAKLSEMYISGEGCERNVAEGVLYAEKASAVSVEARKNLGILYFFGFEDATHKRIQDYEKAYEFFSKSIVYYTSSFFKGLMEYHGVGTNKDSEKAANSFYIACQDMPNDSLAGQCAMCLGLMYLKGDGVGKNEREALKYLKYGAKTAYPKLVAEAKKPLTERDIADWKDVSGGDSITVTPFDWKMFKLYENIGVWGEREGKKMNLLHNAIVFFFSSHGVWPDVKDEM